VCSFGISSDNDFWKLVDRLEVLDDISAGTWTWQLNSASVLFAIDSDPFAPVPLYAAFDRPLSSHLAIPNTPFDSLNCAP
jgi:hypothetical protein